MEKRIYLLILNFAILLSQTISLPAFGGWFSPKSGLAAVKKTCFAPIDWKTVKCTFSQESDYSVSYLRDPFIESAITADLVGHPGLGKREELLTEIKKTVREKELNECQTAALIKCSVSSYLRYADGLPAHFSEPLLNTYSNERGNCRQFSTIFDDLSKELGLNVEIVSGSHAGNSLHAFNIVKIDQSWFYIEPQYADPIFYSPRSGKYLTNLKSNTKLEHHLLYIFLSDEHAKTISPTDLMSAKILPTL